MNSIIGFIVLNISRFNRMRRKPLREIITFIFKRSRLVFIHLRDRVKIFYHKNIFTDAQFFKKLAIESSNLSRIKKALNEGNLEKAKIEFVSHMRTRKTPKFFFNHKDKDQIIVTLKKHFKKSEKQTIKLAEDIMNHRFYLLGKDMFFPGKIDWHTCFNEDGRWPISFSPNIDYFSAQRPGDIKLAWELNRTQHFVILGKAFWFTGDEKYVKEFQNQLLDWIQSNPYKRGINWMEGIEVAIRLISWIWAYFFFLDSQSFNEEANFEFLKSVYLQTKFIEEHLSDKWQINNNHLIAEAVGLIYVGILFPEFIEAESWRKRGIKLLKKELNKQILPDGVTWEQSTGYHLFVTDLCLHAVILARRNEIQIPEATSLKLEKMVDFLNQITNNNGRIPLIGDGDDARVLKIDDTEYDNSCSTITIGSILFNKKDWLRIKSEEAFWLIGDSALEKEQLPIFQSFKIFEDSGYCIMRGKEKYLLFSIGQQDKKYLYASHKHMDMLSIVLEAYGTYFLIDPGTYTYYGDYKWRNYFRSVKSHNTVVIDNDDPVDMNEIFELTSIPFVKIQDYSFSDKFDYIIANLQIYRSLTHTRSIIYVRPKYWVIIDLIEGKGRHLHDLYFHLNYDLNIEFDKEKLSLFISNKKGMLQIFPLVTNGLSGELIEGEVSNKYNVKVSAPIFKFGKRGEPPIIFVTVLYPYEKVYCKEKSNKILNVSQMNTFRNVEKKCTKNKVKVIKIEFSNYIDYLTFAISGKNHLLTSYSRKNNK